MALYGDTMKKDTVLVATLGISWLLSALNKIILGPEGLQKATEHFATSSAFPLIPDIFLAISKANPSLWVGISAGIFSLTGILVFIERTRSVGAIGSIIGNLTILSVAYSGGISVVTTNMLMIGIAIALLVDSEVKNVVNGENPNLSHIFD